MFSAVAGPSVASSPSRGTVTETTTFVISIQHCILLDLSKSSSRPDVVPGLAHSPRDMRKLTFTFLICVQARSSSIDSSRPMPDCLTPPNGTPTWCVLAPLIQM